MTMYEENIKQLVEISNFLELTQPSEINKKYQCTISDAISAFKTLADMGTQPPCTLDIKGYFKIVPYHNISRETLQTLADFNCDGIQCNDCYYNTPQFCIVSLARKILESEETQDEKRI